MSRYLIQSGITGQFLSLLPNGDIGWVQSLLSAIRSGVVDDLEEVQQLIEDHCDRGSALVVDLDAEPH